jgi:hypothetical protein
MATLAPITIRKIGSHPFLSAELRVSLAAADKLCRICGLKTSVRSLSPFAGSLIAMVLILTRISKRTFTSLASTCIVLTFQDLDYQKFKGKSSGVRKSHANSTELHKANYVGAPAVSYVRNLLFEIGLKPTFTSAILMKKCVGWTLGSLSWPHMTAIGAGTAGKRCFRCRLK